MFFAPLLSVVGLLSIFVLFFAKYKSMMIAHEPALGLLLLLSCALLLKQEEDRRKKMRVTRAKSKRDPKDEKNIVTDAFREIVSHFFLLLLESFAVRYRARSGDNYSYMMQLLCIMIAIAPVGYAIARMKPSSICTPFR